MAEYDKKHPEVTVKVVGGINDDKIIAAIRSGKVPDVVSSFTSANVGSYCNSGALDRPETVPVEGQDRRQHVPEGVAVLHAVQGQAVCLAAARRRLRLLLQQEDVQGGRAHEPPKTMSQLTAYAKKLTKKNSDGSIKVAGYNPFLGFYAGNAPDLSAYAPLFGAKYVDGGGKSMLSRDPAWNRMLKWQKSLVDWYGYKKLASSTRSGGRNSPRLTRSRSASSR